MNNRKENIQSYNNLLLKFLNDLVNNIAADTEFKKRTFQDIVERLKQQLSIYNFNFDDNLIKTILSQAFQAYSDILKKYFDHSNIHRIDISHENNENLADEMNEVTTNLTNAVNNMNKTNEYADLIKKIKRSIIYHFQQVFVNYKSVEFEIDQILNDVVVGSMNTFLNRKIEDFSKDVLPDLYSISDKLTHDINEQKVIEDPDININEERDKFINETMDIEIHEGFENGVVTLTVIDQMGNEQVYYDKEAMEKLYNYNQLFESSRPGKKADTSHWPKDFNINDLNNNDNYPENNNGQTINDEIASPSEEITNNINNDMTLTNTDNIEQGNTDIPTDESQNNQININNDSNDNSESFIKSFLSKYNDNKNERKENNNSIINDSTTLSINNDTTDVQNQEEQNGSDSQNDDKTIFNLTDGFHNLPDDEKKEVVEEPKHNKFINFSINSLINKNENEKNNNSITLIDNDGQAYDSTSLNNNDPDVSKDEDLEKIKKLLNNNDTMNSETITSADNTSQTEEITNNISNDMTTTNETSILQSSDLTSNSENDNIATPSFDSEDNSKDEDLEKIKNMINANSSNTPNNGFSFLPTYDNPNFERDEFIKSSTGYSIEEDTDNKGILFLRVTEPSGREKIYTGKEAVQMIKNYNQAYLDANPNKTVDTTLIDNFVEN